MLHYEALQRLTHDRRQQREREAGAERLALQDRGRRQRRVRRLALAAGLEKLLAARRHAVEQ
jgi:hypothetical protein